MGSRGDGKRDRATLAGVDDRGHGGVKGEGFAPSEAS
jgi:hypothetical protein